MKFDIYETITAKIIAELEKAEGNDKWECPWHRTGLVRPYNAFTKRAYNGLNVTLLWLEGRADPRWATWNQISQAGLKVLAGEEKNWTMVTYWKQYEAKSFDSSGNDDEPENSRRFVLRYYRVYNGEQIDGLPELPKTKKQGNGVTANKAVQEMIERNGIVIKHGGDSAHYVPAKDYIQMPNKTAFKGTKAEASATYYVTLLHESVHWTGHQSRLDRDFQKRFGTDARAFEELIAELGSAFACADYGVANRMREDHVPYIKSWVRVLRDHKKAIFSASSQAEKAVKFLVNAGAEENQAA